MGIASGKLGVRFSAPSFLMRILPVAQPLTEGFVNKLKVLKRSMYGRANFDLLRLRFLHRA